MDGLVSWRNGFSDCHVDIGGADAGGAALVLHAARAIAETQAEYLRRVSPESDRPARIDALRGQIAFLDGRKEEARRLLEPAISAMTTAKSNGFEIERAQRTLNLLDGGK